MTFPPSDLPLYNSQADAAIGRQTDAEATGDGSVVAILKRQRTLLGMIAVSVGGLAALTFIGSRLATNTVAATATAAAPTYVEGTDVKLSTDLAGTLRTSTGGGGGNPAGGWLDSLRADRLTTGQAHAGRFTVDSILASQTHIGRAAIDSILANMTHVGRVAVDSQLDSIRLKALTVSGNNPDAVVALGNSLGKTNVLLTGSLTTTAVTADQVVLTRTVTGGKTFYLQYVDFEARLTAVSATGSILGAISLETPSGTKVITHSLTNPTIELDDKVEPFTFAEPVPIAAGVVIRCVTTPAATTSMLWICNFGGYEK